MVTGIAGMEDMKKVGKTGGLALLYFEVVSSIALLIGLLLVDVLQPGAGMNANPATLDTKAIAAYAEPGKLGTTTAFLLNIIPATIFDAFAKGEILQVLLIAVLSRVRAAPLRRPRHAGVRLDRAGSHVLVHDGRLHHAGGADRRLRRDGVHRGEVRAAHAVALALLVGTAWRSCRSSSSVVLGADLPRLPASRCGLLACYINEELLIVLGTSSSESALPRHDGEAAEGRACGGPSVGLVIPTGYSFNLDGTSHLPDRWPRSSSPRPPTRP